MQLWNVKWPFLAIMLSSFGAEIYEVYDDFPLFDEYGILVGHEEMGRKSINKVSQGILNL